MRFVSLPKKNKTPATTARNLSPASTVTRYYFVNCSLSRFYIVSFLVCGGCSRYLQDFFTHKRDTFMHTCSIQFYMWQLMAWEKLKIGQFRVERKLWKIYWSKDVDPSTRSEKVSKCLFIGNAWLLFLFPFFFCPFLALMHFVITLLRKKLEDRRWIN